jgi:hypothetical protein
MYFRLPDQQLSGTHAQNDLGPTLIARENTDLQ